MTLATARRTIGTGLLATHDHDQSYDVKRSDTKQKSTLKMTQDEAFKRPSKPTNDDAESSKPNKRPRTILACLACRQKKRRCDGERPRCQRCVRTDSKCEYSAEFYAIPPSEPPSGSKRPSDGSTGAFARPQNPHPQEPPRPVDPMLAQEMDFQEFDSFKQLESPSLNAPTFGPKTHDNHGSSSFRFDPNEWKPDLQPRKPLSDPPNESSNLAPGSNASSLEKNNSDSYSNNYGSAAQQPYPMTDGLPNQTGLDEWTQLFLTQVFMPEERQPGLRPEMVPPAQSAYPRRLSEQSQIQRQLSTEQSPNQSAPQDAISPQMSNGSSKRAGKFRIPYFRYFGRTAIAPGFRRVTCEVSAPPSPTHDSLSLEPTTDHHDYFDATGEVPNATTLQDLLPIFEQHFGYFFCFISVPDLLEKIRKEEASPILLNAICAISARYCNKYASQTSDGLEMQASSTSSHDYTIRATAYSGDLFAQKAKSQALKVLAVADLDVCAALMILSWNEFACDRDTGLWMYSGMAQRMSVDCGLDWPPAQLESEEDWMRLKLFYCLHLMDSILVIGTGRQGSFKDVLPPVPAFPLLPGTNLHDPFPFLVRLMTLARQIVHSINTLGDPTRSDELSALQQELIDIGSMMPKELQFSIQNLQPYVSVGKSTGFIFMHLWLHTLVILLYAPSIVNDSQAVVHEEGRDIALSSAKTISDIAAFAELVDPKAITQPFLNYPFFTAGRLFVKETLLYVHMSAEDSTGKSKPALALLKSSARQNYERMKSLLKNLEFYWAGVRYITAALTQKAEGVGTAGLDIAQEGPNVSLIKALNTKAKAAKPVVPSDPNWFGFGLTGAFNSPTDQAVTILRPQNHEGQMTAHSGMGLDLATVRDVTIPYGRNPYEWENIANWIGR